MCTHTHTHTHTETHIPPHSKHTQPPCQNKKMTATTAMIPVLAVLLSLHILISPSLSLHVPAVFLLSAFPFQFSWCFVSWALHEIDQQKMKGCCMYNQANALHSYLGKHDVLQFTRNNYCGWAVALESCIGVCAKYSGAL